jgi:hypothetical protein
MRATPYSAAKRSICDDQERVPGRHGETDGASGMKSDLDALWDRMEADADALPADAGCIWWASTYDDMPALLEGAARGW